MAEQRIGIIMHGVTGRMGYNQHLVRSILAIRDQGGIALANGDRLVVDPIIVGRDRDKIERLARKHNIARWGTDLDAALANPDDTIFFDAGTTLMRAGLLERALAAGKPAIIHVKTDAEALTSRITLTQLREQSLARQKLT